MSHKLRFGKCKPHKLPHAPPVGGRPANHLEFDPGEIGGQDEPTSSLPINAHKRMAGHQLPGKLPYIK